MPCTQLSCAGCPWAVPHLHGGVTCAKGQEQPDVQSQGLTHLYKCSIAPWAAVARNHRVTPCGLRTAAEESPILLNGRHLFYQAVISPCFSKVCFGHTRFSPVPCTPLSTHVAPTPSRCLCTHRRQMVGTLSLAGCDNSRGAGLPGATAGGITESQAQRDP